jgi:uncharacterized membrane protein
MRHVLLAKGRLEAFSDGVIAVIITIMVLELKLPHGTDLASLAPLAPTLAAYVLSFVNVGIYWNNHHHMFVAIEGYDGRAMWANLHLLFWLSLIPFMTAWLGQSPTASIPTAVYGFVLFCAGFAYSLLQAALIAANGRESTLARAAAHDAKGRASLVAYAIAIPVAFYAPWISDVLYVAVALMWFVPDRRVERELVAR